MKLRLPDELKALIEVAAATAGRSLNAEIVTRLEESFAATKPVPPHEHALRAFGLRQLISGLEAGIKDRVKRDPRDPTINVDRLAIGVLEVQAKEAERMAVEDATGKPSRKK